MFRLRSAYLALASGLLVNLSGCMSYNPCSEPLFPRLFSSNRPVTYAAPSYAAPADCDCHNSHVVPGVDFSTMQGPVFPGTVQGPVFPGTVQGPQMIVPQAQAQQIPIINTPGTTGTQAPSYLKMPQPAPFPQAAPFPYNPTN
jgi:hypothetical protein